MKNASGHQGENELQCKQIKLTGPHTRHFLHKTRVMRKFLEVSLFSRA